jgi:hypothetical protein
LERGSTAMDEGFVAAGNGDPEMAVSTPLLVFRV